MLMAEDPQLGQTMTPFGSVTFIQIVGVCLEELSAAQQWNGLGVIDLMKSVVGAGGQWLVTDMRRGETIFDLEPELREAVDDGIATQGSNLSGVSARCDWSQDRPLTGDKQSDEDNTSDSSASNTSNKQNNKCNEKKSNGLSPNDSSSVKCPQSRMSCTSSMSVSHDQNQSNSRMSFTSETGAPEPGELIQTKYLKRLHLNFNLEAGNLLPLALR